MKIFIDTANIKEIKEAISLGVIDGVTTNPTLISHITLRENQTISFNNKQLMNSKCINSQQLFDT